MIQTVVFYVSSFIMFHYFNSRQSIDWIKFCGFSVCNKNPLKNIDQSSIQTQVLLTQFFQVIFCKYFFFVVHWHHTGNKLKRKSGPVNNYVSFNIFFVCQEDTHTHRSTNNDVITSFFQQHLNFRIFEVFLRVFLHVYGSLFQFHSLSVVLILLCFSLCMLLFFWTYFITCTVEFDSIQLYTNYLC